MKRIDGTVPEYFARKFDLPPVLDRPNPDTIASMDRWILHLPGQHPFWSDYLLSGSSLADFPGVPPAKKHFANATHEIIVAAIDPGYPKEKLDQGGVSILEPLNHVLQVTTSDERFNTLLEELAIAFINGQLLVEPQGIQGARELFRDRALAFLVGTP